MTAPYIIGRCNARDTFTSTSVTDHHDVKNVNLLMGTLKQINMRMGTLKPQSNEPLYRYGDWYTGR